MMKSLTKKPGLTILGVLLSSVILTFAFAAFMNLQAALIQFIAKSNDEILAQSLANEALELVRGVRDSNFEEYYASSGASPASWDVGINQTPVPTETYFIDLDTTLSDPTFDMPISSCTPTNLNDTCALAPNSEGLYVGSSSPDVKYYRYVEIGEVNSLGNDGLGVTATVIVRYDNSSNKVYRAYTELYNTDM